MKDGKKKSELDLESTFEKLQLKLNDIMGPLGRLWKSVDQQLRSEVTEEEILALPDAAELLELSSLLIGQCSNALTYERRRNVLSSILSGGTSQISAMLKDNKDILKKNEDGMLFGKEFKEQIKESAKDKKKSNEAFDNNTPTRCTAAGSRFRRPFREGPLSQYRANNSNRCGYGGRFKPKFGNKSKQQGSYVKKAFSFVRNIHLQQKLEVLSASGLGGINSSPSSGKRDVERRNPKNTSSRKAKTLPSSLGKVVSRQRNTVHGRGFKNPFYIRTISKEGSSSNKFFTSARKASATGTSNQLAPSPKL